MGCCSIGGRIGRCPGLLKALSEASDLCAGCLRRCADCPCSASGARRSAERMLVWLTAVCALCIVGLAVDVRTHLLEPGRFPVSARLKPRRRLLLLLLLFCVAYSFSAPHSISIKSNSLNWLKKTNAYIELYTFALQTLICMF